MPGPLNQTYRRLGDRRWLRWQTDDAWLGADHLLLVRTRFFSEQYARVYWTDVQAVLLYRLEYSRGLLLAVEIIVIAAASVVAIIQNRFETIAMAFSYVVFYLFWRSTRRTYAVELITRTAVMTIPLAIFRRSSERLTNQLTAIIKGAQGRSDETSPSNQQPLIEQGGVQASESKESSSSDVPMIEISLFGKQRPGRPVLVLHGIVLALGLTTWLLTSRFLGSDQFWPVIGGWLTVLFFGGLMATFFLQQDPAFPFAVRSAAVMNMSLIAAMWVPVALVYRPNGPAILATLNLIIAPVTLLRMLACLFGLIGLYKSSLDEADKPSSSAFSRVNPLV